MGPRAGPGLAFPFPLEASGSRSGACASREEAWRNSSDESTDAAASMRRSIAYVGGGARGCNCGRGFDSDETAEAAAEAAEV